MDIDKILERLGLYDLVAVLLTGVCVIVLSTLIGKYYWQTDAIEELILDKTIYLLVLSYFIGVILQECGSRLQRWRFEKNELLEAVFKDKDEKNTTSSHVTLAEDEAEAVCALVKEKLGNSEEPSKEMVYNYCKFGLTSKEHQARAEKDQALLAMSRSLSIYFFFASLAALAGSVVKGGGRSFWGIAGIILMFGLIRLFYGRFIKFTKLRYAYILRAFYYACKGDSK